MHLKTVYQRSCSSKYRVNWLGHISSSHASDEFTLSLAIPCPLTQASNAPEIAHHVLGFAKVHLLQEIAHLEFHILNQSSHIGNVAVIVVNREILLNLACHVAAKVHLA